MRQDGLCSVCGLLPRKNATTTYCRECHNAYQRARYKPTARQPYIAKPNGGQREKRIALYCLRASARLPLFGG